MTNVGDELSDRCETVIGLVGVPCELPDAVAASNVHETVRPIPEDGECRVVRDVVIDIALSASERDVVSVPLRERDDEEVAADVDAVDVMVRREEVE